MAALRPLEPCEIVQGKGAMALLTLSHERGSARPAGKASDVELLPAFSR
jgi:hypothetical protein